MKKINLEQVKQFFKVKKNVALVVAIIVVVLAVGYAVKKPNLMGFYYKVILRGKKITADEAKAKIENLISESRVDAKVTGVSEESGLYKVMVSFNGQEQPSYVTEDGTKFIQSVTAFDDIEKQTAEAKKQEEATYKPVPKSDKPEVDLYVMAFCPYGNKSEDTMKSVYNLLKNKVDFNFHYIVSSSGDTIQSLHGDKEVAQDEREACVLKYYGKDKWVNFATYVDDKCGSDGSCWQTGAQSLGINTAQINSCVASQGVALMKTEEKSSTDAGASGSPTLVINGSQTKTVYQYGNSDAYKQAICDAFNTAPAECSKTLESSSSASSAQGGSCGN